MYFAYIRVSSKEQNESRQIVAIEEYVRKTNTLFDDSNMFVEKASGKTLERPIYLDMKKRFRKGDVLIIKELDRLGRNMEAIRQEWNMLSEEGVDIVVIDTPIISTLGKMDIERKLISNIVFELLSYMAEKERIKIKQRQAEGIEAAQMRGVEFGRPKVNIKCNELKKKVTAYREGHISAEEAATALGVSRATFFRRLKKC